MPPETPRIVWQTQIRQHTDLFTEGGGLHTLKTWLTGQPDSTMVRPFALALHPDGGLLVTDPGRACVHFFDWAQRRYYAIGKERTGGLPSPVGVCVLSDGRILVSDSRLGNVLAYDRQGKPLGEWTQAGILSRPAGLVADPQSGEVFAADVTAHQIAVFDENGRLLRWLGQRGQDLGSFNFPTHLALTPGGNLIVTDSMNFRLQEVRPDGTGIRATGMAGNAPGASSPSKAFMMLFNFSHPRATCCSVSVAQEPPPVSSGYPRALVWIAPQDCFSSPIVTTAESRSSICWREHHDPSSSFNSYADSPGVHPLRSG
jgi:hypothetical protein